MYKYLRLVDGKIKSDSGDTTWTVGEWQTVKGRLNMCYQGLHCSELPLQSLGFVCGEVLALVETDGKSVIQDNKQVWQKMRLVDARLWQKEDSVALSIFTASLCLENYEKIYPKNKAPRKAIEAAQKWLEQPTEANRKKADAAWSAAESEIGRAHV